MFDTVRTVDDLERAEVWVPRRPLAVDRTCEIVAKVGSATLHNTRPPFGTLRVKPVEG